MKFWPNKENLNWWEFALTILITVIIAAELVIAIYTVRESERAVRLNERPWVNISVGQGRLIDGHPLLMPITFVNSGKSPAKDVSGEIVVNLLRKGQEPTFAYETGHPRYAVDVGTAAPNFPATLSWAVLPESLPPSEELKPILVSPAIRQGIMDGTLYIVVHAKISYSDIFGTKHWLAFCSYVENPPLLSGPNASKCAQYNDVDKNY